MKTSPTQRTLAMLRKAQMTCQVVEHWNAFARRRIDLFGCIDVVAIDPKIPGVLGVQACAGASHAARRTKLLAIPAAKEWLQANNRLWVLSWSKKGPRGGKKLWQPRVDQITIGDFE